jgi:hypothetical protein
MSADPNVSNVPRDISQESAIKPIETILDVPEGEKEIKEVKEINEVLEEEEEEAVKREVNEDTVTITLKLGDIIEFVAPNNEMLNARTFMIEYIDPSKIKLVNADSFQKMQLIIDKDGQIADKTIVEIILLSRNENEGYARQNDLLTGTWINIYFGGDIPAIITGLITDLENDMIEVKTMDKETIYIDFGYQGIPEDIPIETFEIRPPPASETDVPVEDVPEKEVKEGEGEEDVPVDEGVLEDIKEIVPIFIPEQQIRQKISRLIIDADQIEFGDIVKVHETVNIDREKYRYNIESQKNDLLEEMISNIPSAKRSSNVLNNLHIMITRFTQLRELSSTFDANHNITGIIKKSAEDKPLADYLSSFKNSLYWIMMVAKNVKKTYALDKDNYYEKIGDIEIIPENQNFLEMSQLFRNYKTNEGIEGQNKYVELYNSLNRYTTPFSGENPDALGSIFSPVNGNGVIVEAQIASDLNVIIDNLGELYSTVVSRGNETSRRFIIQKYNLGLDRLESNGLKGKKEAFFRVKMTRNDDIAITSILTLPEPTVRFSQVNLPGSSILVKANLNMHFLNYWQLLKQKTKINPVKVTGLDTDIEYTDSNFVDNIKNYMLDLSESESDPSKNLTDKLTDKLSNVDIYNKFLKIVIPKIVVLFNLVKKYIKGKLSMVDLIGYIEPFLIYPSDLTYVNYKEMSQFIQDKIREYNAKYAEYNRSFSVIRTIKSDISAFNPIISILDNYYDIKLNVFGAYNIKSPNQYTKTDLSFSTSENLKKILMGDQGKLFNTAVIFSNLALMYPNELNPIFDLDKEKLRERIDASRANNKCASHIVAKKYLSMEKLMSDNGKVIYFDRDYDTTDYEIIDKKFKEERAHLDDEELQLYITEEFKSKDKLDEFVASYMAETLVNRAKKVIDGQYAIIKKIQNESIAEKADDVTRAELEYYIRQNDEWILAEDIDPKWFIQDNDILCNIQTDCLYKSSDKADAKDGKCESTETTKNTMINNALKDIMSQFDNKYNISKDALTDQIKKHLEYYENSLTQLQLIKQDIFYKYNTFKYNIGLQVSETNAAALAAVSPYTKLKDLIVGQSDFIKRQTDILLFVNKFCRQGESNLVNVHDGEMESFWWMYCIETHTKLMPTFRYMLAKKFMKDPSNYNSALSKLIKEIGKESANGDAWVDVNSGEVICDIEFETDEGYTGSFKNVSRSILEQDQNDVIAEKRGKEKERIEKERLGAVKTRLSPEGEMVSGIVSFISNTMGIDLDRSRDFIVKIVTELMTDVKVIESEAAYKEREKEAVKKGKKLPEYTIVHSSTLLYLTLGTILISIQTSIPSVKTRKTFPGCVRSFSGFPFEGEGDDSGLNYIACIAFKHRNPNIVPWNVLSKVKEDKIAATIKVFTIRYLIPYAEIDQKMKDKVEYLLLNAETPEIPIEHSFTKWLQFLPPLRRFHIKGLENITDGFKEELEREIRTGSLKQHEKLFVIQSKIIKYSLAIQEDIQKIVETKDMLLKASGHPFMINACCNENSAATLTALQYFIAENANIDVNNKIVRDLGALLKDYKILTDSATMVSEVNTKRLFPNVSTDFDEETIYRAFIDLCNFQTTIPLTEDLLAICKSKPDFLSKGDSIKEKIEKLKRNDRKYSNEMFLRLFQIVSRHNIINISLSYANTSYPESLRRLIAKFDEQNEPFIAGPLKQNLLGLLDTYDLSIQDDTDEMTKFKNYLAKSNETMRKELLDFIKRKSKISGQEMKRVTKAVTELTVWDFDVNQRNINMKISDDGMYNYINFFKNFISLFSTVFPEIIIKKESHAFDAPDYWGFTMSHNRELKESVESFYEPLLPFFGNVSVENVVTEIQRRCESVLLLAEVTPALTNIKIGDKEMYSVFDKRTSTLIFEYYILQILNEYIVLTKDPSLISRMLKIPDVEAPLYSSDFLVDQQLRYMESEQQYIEGDVSKLQESIAKLLAAYISIMSSSKATINKSYEKIEDVIFKLKEAEKYTFTDRLKEMTEELRAVDMVKKANKIGVWERGVQKGLKQYDPETYEHDKEVAQQIAEMQNSLRLNGGNMDMDLQMEDALDEKEAQDFIDMDELRMEDIGEDYMDGDPYNDEYDEE